MQASATSSISIYGVADSALTYVSDKQGSSSLELKCKDAAGCKLNQAIDEVAGLGVGYIFDGIKLSAIYTQQKN